MPQQTAPPRGPIAIINLQNTIALTADIVKYELQIEGGPKLGIQLYSNYEGRFEHLRD